MCDVSLNRVAIAIMKHHRDIARREARLARFFRPYHDHIAAVIAAHRPAMILSLHSFTPQLATSDQPRPWQVGILHSHLDERLSRALIRRLEAEGDLCVGDNEPYHGHLPGDAIDRHALTPGRLNTLIEVRNDLIAESGAQQAWADRLARVLVGALADIAG